jgi:putative PIN family toxin of toxin-antitoxin system
VTVVFDTNVLVAALVAKGLCYEALQRALAGETLVSSAGLLDELERTIRGKFQPGPASRAFLADLKRLVTVVEPSPLATPVSRDRDDDLVLATALAAHAEAIVSGDLDLLVLKRYKGIQIWTPREFLSNVS